MHRYSSLFIAALVLVSLFATSVFPAPTVSASPLLAVTISATVNDVLLGDDGDNKADPGETIEYTVVVPNNGDTDATGVTFQNILDAKTTLVGGSLAVSPIGVNDTFPVTVVGNVSINSAALATPFSVTANDYLGLNPAATIAQVSSVTTVVTNTITATSANGGNVVMTVSGADIGKFTYDPPAGFEGTDTFTYVLADNSNAPSAAANRTATVSITVSGMIWFINNSASSCTAAGCGRLSNPFSTLAAFNTLNDNGGGNRPGNNDNIFVFESATGYSGAVTLLTGQKLIGQDATTSLSTITGLTPPTGSAALPIMNSGNGTETSLTSTVTLNTSTTVRGLRIDSTSGTGMNDPVAAITGVSVSEVKVNTTTGTALNISSATGTFNFMGLTTAGGAGANLSNNGGSTFTFTNVAVSSGSNTAFSATGGGTVNVCDENPCNAGATGLLVNTLTSTTGTALNISNTTIGANNLEFRSISANGATNGILLNNTGSSGSLVVKGNGGSCTSAGTCTGGAIQNTSGDGLSLTNTNGVSLTRLFIGGSGNHGINTSTINGLTLTSAYVTNSGNGDNEHGLNLVNVQGTITLDATTFNNASEDLVHLENNNRDVALNVTNNSQFSYPSSVGGFANSAILLLPGGTSAITASIQNATFTNVKNAAAQISANQAGSTGTQTFTFSNNTITVSLSGRASGVVVGGQESTRTNITITGNNFSGAGGNGVLSFDTNDSSIVRGTVSNNIISNPPGVGIFVAVDEGGRSDITLDANTITNSGGDAIQTVNFGGTGNSTMDMTITNNQVNGHSLNTSVNFLGGIVVDMLSADSSPSDAICAVVRGNIVSGTPASPTQCGGAPCVDYYLEEIDGTMTLEEVPNTASTTANAAYVNSINDAGPVSVFGTIDLTNGLSCNITGLGMLQDDTRVLSHQQGETRSVTGAMSPSANHSLIATSLADQTQNARFTASINSGSGKPLFSPQRVDVSGAPVQSGETVNVTIGTLPVGKSVTIKFRATVDPLDPGEIRTRILNQGTIAGSNFGTVTTSESPADASAACTASPSIGTQTCTPVDRPDTTIASIDRQAPSVINTNANSVTWRVTFGDAIAGLTSSNFTLTQSGISGASVTGVSAVTGSPDTQWDITATTGTGDGTLGLDFANDTALSHDVPAFTTGQDYSIDKTPPAAPAVTSPANGSSTNDTTPLVTGTAEVNSTVTIYFDGASIGTTTADGSGNWTFTPGSALSEASHTVKATATDAAGNTSSDSSTSTFAVDTTAPVAPVVTTPANSGLTNDTTPTVTGTAEANSTVRVYFDGASAGTTTADASGNWIFTAGSALSDDSHTVKATATDAAGNTSPDSNTNTFTIDSAAPAAPVVVVPADGSSTGDNTPTVTGTAEADSTVTIYIDGSSAGTTTANGSGNWTFTPVSAVSDGSHTVKARATDAASNTSVDSNTNTFTIDSTAPPAPVVVVPADSSTTNDTTPTVTGTAEANSTVTVYLDGSSAGKTTADGSGNWDFTTGSALGEGSHTVKATATDAQSNTSPDSSTNTFSIDITPPAAPVLSAPANGSLINDATPTVTGTAEGNSTVTVYFDGSSAGTTTANGSGNWTFTPGSALSDGSHIVKAAAMDGAGFSSPDSNTNTFTIDTTAPTTPVVLVPADASSTVDTTPAISGTADVDSTVTVYFDGSSAGTTTADASGNWSFTPGSALSDGSHTVKSMAVDAAGNTSADSNTNIFIVDTTAPDTSINTAPTNPSNSTTANFTFDGNDGVGVGGLTFECQLNGGGFAACAGAGTQSYSGLAEGSHTFDVRATDSLGHVDNTPASYAWTVDTSSPSVVVSSVTTSPTNVSPITVTITFSQAVTGFTPSVASGDIVIGGVGGTDSNPTGSGTTYTFDLTPSGPGAVTVTVPAGSAQDAATNFNTASNTFSIVYDPAAPSVTINQSVGQSDPTDSSPIHFTVVFSEPVTGFTTGKVDLSGTAGATIATVSEIAPMDDTTFDVAVSGLAGDGTVVASIAAAVAQDEAGNQNTASTNTDNSVLYDATSPSVTINQAAGQNDPTSTSPIEFTVVFSEAVTDFDDSSDVTLSGTAGATTASITETAPNNGTTYNVSVSGMTSTGTVIASVPASAAVDFGSKPNAASTSTDNTVTYDTSAPTVTINQAAGQADPTGSSPVNFTVVFSEAVTGFDDPADVTLSGTAGATSVNITGGPTTYNVAVSGMGSSGTVFASVPSDAAQDLAANNSAASTSTDNSVTLTADTTTTITSDTPDPSQFGQSVTVSFTVTSAYGTPTGDVTITDDLSGASCTASIAVGSCDIVLTTSGAHTLTATYAGDGTFNASSDTESHTIGATIAVTTFVDELNADGDCSLREAIRAANLDRPVDACPTGSSSSVDVITLAPGTYKLRRGGYDNTAVKGDLDITGDTYIIGAGTANTIISGANLPAPGDRIFHVLGGTVRMDDLTITRGKKVTGAGIFNAGNLTLNNVKLSSNLAPAGDMRVSRGGAIYNIGTLTLNNTIISGNVARTGRRGTSQGGGIFNSGDLTLNNSTVTANTAVSNAKGKSQGGGIFTDASGSTTLNSSTVSGNKVVVGAGGTAQGPDMYP